MVETMYLGDKYIYQCSKCHFLASIGGDTNKVNQCPKCNSIMINTHITIEQWNAKTKEEKNRIKHPWYIIYLSFWNHDIENISE